MRIQAILMLISYNAGSYKPPFFFNLYTIHKLEIVLYRGGSLIHSPLLINVSLSVCSGVRLALLPSIAQLDAVPLTVFNLSTSLIPGFAIVGSIAHGIV